VNDILSVGGILTAFGLSSASGLNAYLPLLVSGILVKTGYLSLGSEFHSLGTWPVIAVLAVLFVVDFVGDKVPAVDHIFHAVGTVVHPIAGALAFASQTGVVKHVHPILAVVIGAAAGGGIHLGRAAIRPVSTVATGGFATPFVSVTEDITSGVTTALAVLIPIAAIFLVLWTLWMLLRLRKRFAAKLPPPIARRAQESP
jgi:Domain of unknown function (DUF4126)